MAKAKDTETMSTETVELTDEHMSALEYIAKRTLAGNKTPVPINLASDLENLGAVVVDRNDSKGDEVACLATSKAGEVLGYDVRQAAMAESPYQVEDNGPPPPVRAKREALDFPFYLMEPGQSFFVAATPEMPQPSKKVATAASVYTKREAEKGRTVRFTTKKFPEGKGRTEEGVRCWRIE